MTVVVQVSQAETRLNEMTLKTSFEEDRGEFHLWNESGRFFIEYSGNADHSPAVVRRSEVPEEQVTFLMEKLDELKSLKNSPACENRELTVTYRVEDEIFEHKGCMDLQDKISNRLYQLSSIMTILI